MFYQASNLKDVYVELMPTKSGTNMWKNAGTNKFTVWDYETNGSPLQQ